MIDERIKEYKTSLENRAKAIEEMSKTGKHIASLGTLVFVGSLLLVPFFAFPQLQNVIPQPIALDCFFGFFGLGIMIMFIGIAVNLRRGVPQIAFSPEEDIFLNLFEALTFFETYQKQNLELARYQCIRKLNVVRRLMSYYWKPSDIAVVTKEIGNEIETFKEKFAKSLLFILKNSRTRNEEKIKVVDNVLNEFGEYLIEPSKERLRDLNQKMDSLHPEDMKPLYSLMDSIRQQRNLRHILVTILILTASLFSAFFGFYYIHISADTAAVVFATIFGPLVAVYFSHVLRKH